MKSYARFFLLPALCVFLAGPVHASGVSAPAGSATATAPAGPSVQMVETSFDFGELVDGKEYVHDFKIKNVGTAPLEIKKVLPG